MTRSYELLFIIAPNVEAEEDITAIIERFKGIIEAGGGAVTNINRWGRRKLAYEIKGFTEGFYVIMEFDSDSDLAKELERLVKLTDTVIRHLLIRADDK
jgi:small subunit ribosomal protein S6